MFTTSVCFEQPSFLFRYESPEVKKEKKTEITNQVEEIFEFLPEVQSIKDYAGEFFNTLHDDKNLDNFSQFFEDEVFKNKNPRTMFFLYKSAMIDLLKNKTDFKSLSEKLIKSIESAFEGIKETFVSEKVTSILQETFTKFHRGLPTIAIAKAKGKTIKEVDLSKELDPVEKSEIKYADMEATKRMVKECVSMKMY